MEESNLQELIRRSREGEKEAQNELVKAVQDRVYYHCQKMMKKKEDAEDATQDVLFTMIGSLDKLFSLCSIDIVGIDFRLVLNTLKELGKLCKLLGKLSEIGNWIRYCCFHQTAS